VGGVLYTPTVRRTIVALESDTGREVWKYDLGKAGAPLRGVSYWRDRENPPLILAGTTDGELLGLNAKTGALFSEFGRNGEVDLRIGVTEKFPTATYRMTSPGAIYRNLIITGAQGKEDDPDGPAMDVRAWDVRTGKLIWTFHTIPHPGLHAALLGVTTRLSKNRPTPNRIMDGPGSSRRASAIQIPATEIAPPSSADRIT
jgi:glucose dehydrogenase